MGGGDKKGSKGLGETTKIKGEKKRRNVFPRKSGENIGEEHQTHIREAEGEALEIAHKKETKELTRDKSERGKNKKDSTPNLREGIKGGEKTALGRGSKRSRLSLKRKNEVKGETKVTRKDQGRKNRREHILKRIERGRGTRNQVRTSKR